MQEIGDVIRGHCPKCGDNRKAVIKGGDEVIWSDPRDAVSSSDTLYILECSGCEARYMKREYWFSEWDEYDYEDGHTRNVRDTYWPSPIQRARPSWINGLVGHDQHLSLLIHELYSALDADLLVLAAIGARTAFDRSSELLGVPANLSFVDKRSDLVARGLISQAESLHLQVLIDAGGAAAHRGWRPELEKLGTMMDVLETFLHRSFVLGIAVTALQSTVPKRTP